MNGPHEPTREELLLILAQMGRIILAVVESATPPSRDALLDTIVQLSHMILAVAGVTPAPGERTADATPVD